jgi:hypothetical protein
MNADFDFVTDRLAVGNVASRAVPGFVAVVSLLTKHDKGRPWGPELTDKTPKVPGGITMDELVENSGPYVPVLVVDIADGEEAYRGQGIYYPHDRDLDVWLDSATAFVARYIQHGCVLVHCGAGASRSGAVAVAYLCRYAGMGGARSSSCSATTTSRRPSWRRLSAEFTFTATQDRVE